jgi:hypothetical protein
MLDNLDLLREFPAPSGLPTLSVFRRPPRVAASPGKPQFAGAIGRA